MGQCCCGRFKDLDESLIINDKVHEPLGPPGNFCGPFISHKVRWLEDSINSLESENRELREALKDLVEMVDRARGILQRNSDGEWCMLDTKEAKQALANHKEK